MDPISAIMWIGVAVFAATSMIALLYLAGYITGPYQKLLIGTLITQIVIAGTSAFAAQLQKPREADRLPIKDLIVVEQAPPQTIYDGDKKIFLRAADISRARRVADMVVAVRQDFTDPISFTLEPGAPKSIAIGGKKYRFSFSKMGQIDADTKEPMAQTSDFIFLAIESAKS